MEHKIVTLREDTNGIPAHSEGTIVFEYSRGVYEVEFNLNGKPFTETLTEEEIVIS